jgi:23S rRNA pseudouridine955/2504/2580 synthase
MKRIVIKENEMEQRLDRFLCKYLNNTTKTNVFKLIRKKRIKINGKKVTENYFLKYGDVLDIILHPSAIEELIKPETVYEASDVNLDIVYEDEEILVVNKPVGLLTHPDQNEYKRTLATAVQLYLKDLSTRTFKPASIQRLDKNTSGLVLFGKTYEALKKYNALMRDRKIKKYYLAVVSGKTVGSGEIKGYLTKDEKKNKITISKVDSDESKFIHTKYKTLKTNGQFSLLEVELLTGRTHQIRGSLSYIGHPIIGDVKYGGSVNTGHQSQLLHAYKLQVDDKSFEKESEEIKIFVNNFID